MRGIWNESNWRLESSALQLQVAPLTVPEEGQMPHAALGQRAAGQTAAGRNQPVPADAPTRPRAGQVVATIQHIELPLAYLRQREPPAIG